MPLLELPGAASHLTLWKADLTIDGSFDNAISGCTGVFHVATPMDFESKDPEVSSCAFTFYLTMHLEWSFIVYVILLENMCAEWSDKANNRRNLEHHEVLQESQDSPAGYLHIVCRNG